MRTIGPPRKCAAFTRTECLVVLSVAAFILLMPCLASTINRERIHRMVCLNNLRQMGVGSQLYAAEDPKGRLAGSLPQNSSPTPEDDLNWLYGYGPSRNRYIQDLKTFVCPATQNSIRTNEYILPGYSLKVLVDLSNNAKSTTTFGHSYEVLSYWTGPVHKTLQSTATFRKKRDPLIGVVPGPSMIMLIYDGMEYIGPGSIQNYPNPYASHGAEGGNMLFCDGHSEWVGTKTWTYRWNVSQDSTVTDP